MIFLFGDHIVVLDRAPVETKNKLLYNYTTYRIQDISVDFTTKIKNVFNNSYQHNMQTSLEDDETLLCT